ncbi:lactonase family protein [Planococcus sp. CPCC 101016]|uniref:lactonase family protein n=1 Tax=Planococcus sp. CPCC 101016 TaxID=2599617 RepID=UPI0011B758AC|nr:lactonase family protein [Planococcus sp. CPCC 101016]TWT04342.1 lactonase family protein [Planococcus sp. CPCC 101016]
MATSFLLTGSYSSEKEPGIKLWEFEDNTGKLTEQLGVAGIERPSFLAVHPNGTSFVAASEVGNGELVSYWIHPIAKKIVEINRQSSNGDHPAHVTIDETGQWLLSVTYSGATVNVYPLHANGSIGTLAASVKHGGSGPDADRQDAAHPHSVIQVPGKNLFLVSDLGTDTIFTYKLDADTGALALRYSIQTEAGAGPRHLSFHPTKPFVYSLNEINSTLMVYRISQSGQLEFLQLLPLIPDSYKGGNTSAEIAVSSDGRFVYASNRGHDSIASFAVQHNGTLEVVGLTDSGGEGPRHFAIIPGNEWLVVANENSHTLTVLKVHHSGAPCTVENIVQTTAPVCVKVIH